MSKSQAAAMAAPQVCLMMLLCADFFLPDAYRQAIIGSSRTDGPVLSDQQRFAVLCESTFSQLCWQIQHADSLYLPCPFHAPFLCSMYAPCSLCMLRTDSTEPAQVGSP